MEVPTDNPLNESDARKYFRDVHSGIEYRKLRIYGAKIVQKLVNLTLA